ncbi:glutamine-hydrolyzing carbamoyl-phosphate synthase small subunit [Candidatus Margulisiibacteriota bacterium]
MSKKAILFLEDGTKFEGVNFGAEGESFGEVVFNTSMTGYQEILTDPSYNGQIVTMTYSMIGNYGVNDEDVESSKPWVKGFVVREYSKRHSNWRAQGSLGEYLKKNNIVGIEMVDTRKITRHTRDKGAMKGIISTVDFDEKSLLAKLKKFPGLIGQDLVQEVTGKEKYIWPGSEKGKYKVVAFDFGIKHNILRELAARDCQLTVVPAQTSAEEVLAMDPDGFFLSNGPGDPEPVIYAIETIKKLIESNKPVFGICLGHQLIGLALGGKTYKLKFGHRGGNQPVKDLLTGKVEITSQNHGFCVDINSLPKDIVEITHLNLNDQTAEGLQHKAKPVFCVQYHPEASPGPHDSKYLFDRFVGVLGLK